MFTCNIILLALFTINMNYLSGKIIYHVIAPLDATKMEAMICALNSETKVSFKKVDYPLKLNSTFLDVLQCLKSSIFNLKRPQDEDEADCGHYIVSSSHRLTVTVYIYMEASFETYSSLATDQFGTRYNVVRTRGQDYVIAFAILDTTIYFKYDEKEPSFFYLKKDVARFAYSCEGDSISANKLYLWSDKKFAVIVGRCFQTADNGMRDQGIEMLLDESKYRGYECLSFTIPRASCELYIYSNTTVDIVHVHRYNSTYVYSDGTLNEPLILDYCDCLIRSSGPVQVMATFARTNYQNLRGVQALCILLPSDLFSSAYLVKVDFTSPVEHYIVIMYKDIPPSIVWINSDSLSILEVKRVNCQSHLTWRIEHYRLVESQSYVRTTSGQTFGCYIYGKGAALYASPVTLPDAIDRPGASMCSLNLMIKGDNKDNDCDGEKDEEIVNNIDDDFDGLIDEDAGMDTKTGCFPGWYGEMCDKICRCLPESSCTQVGSCAGNYSCAVGYFGTDCQYIDNVQRATLNFSELKNRLNSDCQRNYYYESPLLIIFNAAVKFSWILIEAIKVEQLQNIQITFKTSEGLACYSGPCNNRRNLYLDDHRLMVICDVNQEVCSLTLLWTGTLQMCSIYASGGRNMALRQKTLAPRHPGDTVGDVSLGLVAVDGRYDYPNSIIGGLRCSRTNPSDSANVSMVMFFGKAVSLDQIVLHFKDSQPNTDVLLILLDDMNKTLAVYNAKATQKLRIILDYRHYVKSLQLFLDKQPCESGVTLYELEAFGECAPPMFGPDCSDICSISCEDQMCTYEGNCRRPCLEGTGGAHCLEGCLDWCMNDVIEDPDTPNTSYQPRAVTWPPSTRAWGYNFEILLYPLFLWLAVFISCFCVAKWRSGSDTPRSAPIAKIKVVTGSVPTTQASSRTISNTDNSPESKVTEATSFLESEVDRTTTVDSTQLSHLTFSNNEKLDL